MAVVKSGKAALIIQARMGSTRLPGKSMMPLAGEPLVGRILERVKRIATVDEIVLAVPETSDNDPLAALVQRYGVSLVRGSENDLVDRYYQAARAVKAEIVLRLPADNPCPEPAEIERILAFHRTGAVDFSSNLAQVFDSGYPDGIGAEVFDFASLAEVWRDTSDARRREHVHLNFFDYGQQKSVQPKRFTVGTVDCPAAFRRPDLVLDVNTPEQYAYMSALYDYLYPRNPRFHITDIVAWHDKLHTR